MYRNVYSRQRLLLNSLIDPYLLSVFYDEESLHGAQAGPRGPCGASEGSHRPGRGGRRDAALDGVAQFSLGQEK